MTYLAAVSAATPNAMHRFAERVAQFDRFARFARVGRMERGGIMGYMIVTIAALV
ncbi:hypothetical protein ACFWD7_24330 [Streptomyces mirabilis]|uniref:hypothetical protein n=1 Tax=Streptomyces mirabilis TaxID=68239 RepID=UPI0021BFEB08|nr:hypothetical protein [Streptomyces mirabilis]MCT9106604.1 hypothetical protein [Streptomyces mirabilis]